MRHQKLIIAIGSFLALVVIISFTVILVAPQKKQPIIAPLSKKQAQISETPADSIQKATYYISISQKFLTKGEEISSQKNQSAQDKERILAMIQNSLDTINQGINYYPQDDRLFAQRAKIYQGIADFSPNALNAALSDFNQARKLSPQNPIYPKTQSKILIQQGKYQDAVYYANLAYQIEPTNLQNLANLGQVQTQAGQINNAINSYQSLISFLPQNSEQTSQIKKEIKSLQGLLAQTKQNENSQLYLAGQKLIPTINEIPSDIQLLPQKQASLTKDLIIAAPNEENNSSQSSQADFNAIAGTGILPAQQKEIIIYNRHVSNQKQILLSAESDLQNQVLFVKTKKADPDQGKPYFIVALHHPLDQIVEFKWWIIEK